MNTPTEPGYYWAKVAYTGDWIPVQMFQNPTGLHCFLFQRRDPAKLTMFSEWGPKIEPPETWCQNPQQPMDVYG